VRTPIRIKTENAAINPIRALFFITLAIDNLLIFSNRAEDFLIHKMINAAKCHIVNSKAVQY